MNYDYVIFSPYFGKLPNYFNLWANSCSYNKKIKFIVFTDDKSYMNFNIPNNVFIEFISFKDFKRKINSKFDFEISLESPYKLCDFKPIYGYVFPEYIKKCKFWGYCDMDIIFGDICKFLPENIFSFDKISFLGHFCLYRNNRKINEMFMNSPKGTLNYVDILSNKQHFGFDEIGKYGINNIFKLNNLKVYNYEINVADINCRKKRMNVIEYNNGQFINHKENVVFNYNCGKLLAYFNINSENNIKEYAYIHLQKRKMVNLAKNSDKFTITYDSFINYIDIDIENYSSLISKQTDFDFTWLKFKKKAIKNRLKRYCTIQKILRKKG